MYTYYYYGAKFTGEDLGYYGVPLVDFYIQPITVMYLGQLFMYMYVRQIFMYAEQVFFMYAGSLFMYVGPNLI